MAFATGTGAEVQKPLATVVIGGLISERLEGVGEAGGNRVRRLEQRGAVEFTCMAVAVVVILLITIWGWL